MNINSFLQYDILKKAGIKRDRFVDNFHFQTVNIVNIFD